MNLRALYEGKARLEQAAIAGTSLLEEDFRLRRAAETLKPLAASSPVLGKISAGLDKLLSAPAGERSGLLLDLLALMDAVAYTQGRTGLEGELSALPTGSGTCQELSYSQLRPILTALTGTGGGRTEVVRDSWKDHPEYFTDYRLLSAVAAGLGDSYGELAELNASILKGMGSVSLPLLKEGFDPAGKKEMVRRVEVIAALEGAQATPWLREILPQAKKGVRGAVIKALGADPDSVPLLLELAKTERGTNRDALLTALSKQSGAEVRSFWEKELEANSGAVRSLCWGGTDLAADLVAHGLQARIQGLLERGKPVTKPEYTDLECWCNALKYWSAGACGKSAPSMLDFWRWADGRMEEIHQLRNHNGQPLGLSGLLGDSLLDSLHHAGPGPLAELCLTLWEEHRDQPWYLSHALTAALMTRPAAQVYDTFSVYILTEVPQAGEKQKVVLQSQVLRVLEQMVWVRETGQHRMLKSISAPAEPLDARWLHRLTQAVCKPTGGKYYPFGVGDAVNGFDKTLIDLVNPKDPEQCAWLIPYFRQRMLESESWYSYARCLLRLGGSPRGLLKKGFSSSKQTAHLYFLWQVLEEASRVLPAGEAAVLLREVQDVDQCFRNSQEQSIFRAAFPYTMAALEAGRPFPAWDEWMAFG